VDTTRTQGANPRHASGVVQVACRQTHDWSKVVAQSSRAIPRVLSLLCTLHAVTATSHRIDETVLVRHQARLESVFVAGWLQHRWRHQFRSRSPISHSRATQHESLKKRNKHSNWPDRPGLPGLAARSGGAVGTELLGTEEIWLPETVGVGASPVFGSYIFGSRSVWGPCCRVL